MSTPTPQSSLALGYTCDVCRQTLTLSGPPIIGENPPQRMARVADMMSKHFLERHKKEFTSIGIGGQQYSGWRLTEQFGHNDIELAQFANNARWQFRMHTKRIHIPDDLIAQQVKAVMATDDFKTNPEETLVKVLKSMRDSLDEVRPA